jgi:zinc protease
MADPRVAQPYVVRTYLAPERDPGAQEQAAALTYLAELLGGSGTTSVLARKLQFEQQKAVFASAGYSGTSLDDSSFSLVVVPVPGVSLAEAEAAMDAVLQDFLRDGIDPEAFERLRTQLRASEIYARDNTQGLARRYGEALTSGLTVADVQAWPQVLQSVTPEDVMAAARDVLDRRRAVTGWLVREEEQAQ